MKVNQKNALLIGLENQWHELKISVLMKNRSYTSCFQCQGRVSLMSFLVLGGIGNQWLSDAVLINLCSSGLYF